jgi:hypothetical protein
MVASDILIILVFAFIVRTSLKNIFDFDVKRAEKTKTPEAYCLRDDEKPRYHPFCRLRGLF